MELSDETIQMTNILDLPMDILRGIFGHLENSPTKLQNRANMEYRWPINDSTNCRQALRSARLVCRLFHQLASPLLCPILQVRLENASLNIVDGISRSPLIAAGVRSIQVVLDYCPGELAADLSRFKDQRKKDLNEISKRCQYFADICWPDDPDENKKICSKPYSEYVDAIDYYRSICSAWDNCFSPTNEDSKGAKNLKYQHFLRQCHKEFQRKHEEQIQLITDGSLVSTIALSMLRMPHCGSVQFVDRISRHRDPYLCEYKEDPTMLLNNINAFAPFMTSPLDWITIEQLEGGAKLVPAKILSELPIAIHQAGATLRKLYVGCFPTLTNYSIICPYRYSQLNPAWAELRAACQNLESFEFGGPCMNLLPIRRNPISAQDRIVINQYLGTILSSQILEDVNLDLWCLAIVYDKENSKGWYPLGLVLSAINWLCIKRLSLWNISLDQDELEKLFEKLGYGLEVISLRNIRLQNGSWADALDILRTKVLSKRSEMRCRIDFSRLTGGEFEEGKKKTRRDPWDLINYGDLYYQEPLPIILLQKYISSDELAENPLKENGNKAT